MSATPSPRPRRASPRRSGRWWWLLALPLLVVGLVLGVRQLLQPERLSAFLLAQASKATGLQLSLAQPAGIGLWPDLHLELRGLTARASDGDAVLLHAAQVDAVLPWSALGADMLQLRSLRLHAPVLDVDALQAWLAARHAGSPMRVWLPRLDAALTVVDGRVVAPAWSLSAVALELPSLRDGAPTTLALRGIFESAGAPPRAFDLRIATTPRQLRHGLRFDPVALSAHDGADDVAWMRLDGRAALPEPGRLEFELAGEWPRWPTAWGELPLPPAPGIDAVRVQLDYRGALDLQGDLVAHVARGDERIVATLRSGDVLAWLRTPAATPLPPLLGTLAAPRLRVGAIELDAVTLTFAADADADAATPAAAAASAPDADADAAVTAPDADARR